MAARKTYTVTTDAPNFKLNIRENPSLNARILRQLSYGDKVKIDPKADTPDGWKALEDGGFTMAQYLK